MKSALILGTTFATTFAHGPEADRRLVAPTLWEGSTGGELGQMEPGCAFKPPSGIFPIASDVFESISWQSHDNCAADASCAATQTAPVTSGQSESDFLNDNTIFGYEKQRMKVNLDATKLDLENYRYYFLNHESNYTNLNGDADVRHETESTLIGADMSKWTEICPNKNCTSECYDGTAAKSQESTGNGNSFENGQFFGFCEDRPSEMTTMRYSCFSSTTQVTNGNATAASDGSDHNKDPWTCYEVDTTNTMGQPFDKVFHIGVASICGRDGDSDEIFMWATYTVKGDLWQVSTATNGSYTVNTVDYTSVHNTNNAANEVIFVYGDADNLLGAESLTSTTSHTETVALDYGAYSTKCYLSLRWATSNDNTPENPITNAKGMGGEMNTVWHTPHACSIEGTFSANVKKNSFSEVCSAGLDISCGTTWGILGDKDKSISTRTSDEQNDMGGAIPKVYYASVVVENTRISKSPKFAFHDVDAFTAQGLNATGQTVPNSDYENVEKGLWYQLKNKDPFAILDRNSAFFTVDCRNTNTKGSDTAINAIVADSDQPANPNQYCKHMSNGVDVTKNNTLNDQGYSDPDSTQTFMDRPPQYLIAPKHKTKEQIVFSHVYVRGILTVHAEGPGSSSSNPDDTSRTSHDYDGTGPETGQDPNTGPEEETVTGNEKDVTSRRLGARNSKPLTATKTAIIGESYGSHRRI